MDAPQSKQAHRINLHVSSFAVCFLLIPLLRCARRKPPLTLVGHVALGHHLEAVAHQPFQCTPGRLGNRSSEEETCRLRSGTPRVAHFGLVASQRFCWAFLRQKDGVLPPSSHPLSFTWDQNDISSSLPYPFLFFLPQVFSLITSLHSYSHDGIWANTPRWREDSFGLYSRHRVRTFLWHQ